MGPSLSHRVSAMWVVRRRLFLTACLLLTLFCVYCSVVKGLETRNDASQLDEMDAEDLQALLRIKESLVDNSGVLGSWDGNNTTPCSWTGVVCRARDVNTSQPVVVALILKNCNLSGTISPSIGQLRNLETLYLGNNFLTGEIPPQIGNLSALRFLDLSFNSLSGNIPFSLGNLGRLEEAIFDDNHLTGEIPSSMENLLSCSYFSVQGNWGLGGLIPAGLRIIPELNLQDTQLRGPLPSDFYDSNLNTFLYLNSLNFSGGNLPDFSRLRNLRGLHMRNASLARGPIPWSLAVAQDLEELDFSENSFTDIPQWIATFPKLKVLLLSNNEISGSLPQQLGRNSELSVLDVSGNNLNGTLPEGLCDGGQLEVLNVSRNMFDGLFTGGLQQNCSSLLLLDLGSNSFSGNLPTGLASGFGNLSSLDLSRNSFDGSIPWDEFGSLKNLNWLDLSHNQLSGEISAQIGSLRRLRTLDLSFNMLNGPLPPELKNCTELRTLYLQGNLFEGSIPVEALSHLDKLLILNLSGNRLEGNVEEGIGGSFTLIGTLNFSRNSLTGGIPRDFNELHSLRILDLSRNLFSGEIPNFRELESLQTLDLSYNQLSGRIPSTLLNLEKLENLNLSYNMLSGSIPGSRTSWPTSSFIGNDQLCLSCVEAVATPESSPKSGLNKGALAGIIVGSVIGLAIIVGIIVPLCMATKCCAMQGVLRGRAHLESKNSDKQPGVKPFLVPEIFKGFSYADIMAATRNFSQESMIGGGGYGTVYLGEFPNGMTCAVKQIVLQDQQEPSSRRSSFQNYQLREVEVAGESKHKNVVNLLGFCQKGEETLVVYEFMPNGSLGDALHSKRTEKLNWRTRFNILFGAACALEYMHEDCRPQILHRDLKSNNILLDANFEARITDFGMAKMMENAGISVPRMANITGSAGYLAPEYYRNMKITDKSDVYSFGVVILETLTGMHPVDKTSLARMSNAQEDFTLVDHVISTLRQEGVLESILDTVLQQDVIESQDVEQQMMLVLQVGLMSTMENPQQRPSMREVVEMFEYSRGEHGKIHVPDLGEMLQNLAASPPSSPERHLGNVHLAPARVAV